MRELVIEGVLTEAGFQQTNGTSFAAWLAEHDAEVRRAAAWEAITLVHDAITDNERCEPVESALEQHFGFVEARESVGPDA